MLTGREEMEATALRARPGPRNELHTMWNAGESRARMFVITSPATRATAATSGELLLTTS